MLIVMAILGVAIHTVHFDFDFGQFHYFTVSYLHFDHFPLTAAIAATFIIPSTFVFVIAFNIVNFLIRESFAFGFNPFLIN